MALRIAKKVRTVSASGSVSYLPPSETKMEWTLSLASMVKAGAEGEDLEIRSYSGCQAALFRPAGFGWGRALSIFPGVRLCSRHEASDTPEMP